MAKEIYHHEPEGYDCPFCKLARGGQTHHSSQDDVIYRDEKSMAFLASKNWPNNRYHVLVVPTQHIENIYELSDDVGGALMTTTRKVALALKSAYGCSGVSIRQHNEPDGNQDVWHLHIHVFPRYRNDMLNWTRGRNSSPAERKVRARRLRAAFNEIGKN